ncbi:ABC transporter substrate-binding protein [Catellatospora methionotrophica]|uniref:ABC transporter substrate-binding protein n=1 Tax=Catellatospora methionotrophica TaxID=121620 RepID=UPI0033CB87C0
MRLTIRTTRLLGVAVAAAVLATGCAGSPAAQNAQGQNGSSAPAGAASTITIGIDVPFHPIWNYVQSNKDTYFGGKPYRVDFKVLDATTQVPAFGKGDLQVMTTVPSFMPIVKKQYGIDTTYVFPLARWTVGPQILVKKGSPYRTLADLKGRTVAISPLKERFGAEQAAVLGATGQKIEDYFKLEQTSAAAQQLTLGRVDAAFIEAPTTYPLLQGGQFEAIYSVHDAFQAAFSDPAVMNGGYIVRRDFVAGNQQFLKDLVAATEDAWNKYQQDPKAVNEVASKVSGIPVEQLDVVGQVLDLKTMPLDQRQVTQRDIDTWVKLFPLLQQAGFIEVAPADVPAMFVLTSQLKK